MAASGLPENGELRLGSIRLPAGRRIHAHGFPDGSTPAVAWVTIASVPDPGQVWSALSEASQHTGLIPFLAATQPSDPRRPWQDGITSDFDDPYDLVGLHHLDAAVILEQRWNDRAQGQDEYADEEEETRFREWERTRIAPFTPRFPGLAPATTETLRPGEMQGTLGGLAPARIGLVAASRAADTLAAMGWGPGNWIGGTLPVTAVLRSWEDRFGARLLEVGIGEFKLLVERPPRTRQAAVRIAAEQWAFADECSCAGETGLTEVGSIAACLVNAPVWGFWWD